MNAVDKIIDHLREAAERVESYGPKHGVFMRWELDRDGLTLRGYADSGEGYTKADKQTVGWERFDYVQDVDVVLVGAEGLLIRRMTA